MQNKVQTLPVSIDLRYYISEIEEEDIEQIVFVFHGYGQLAEFFIRKFQKEKLQNTLIVAPEGRHRFYLGGTSGRVGASWMTSEWRTEDIALNNQHFETLIQSFTLKHPNALIHVLGFSQGGASVARWSSSTSVKIDKLVLWASVFPPDIEELVITSADEKIFVLGNKDEYFNLEQQEIAIESYEEKGFKTYLYEGNHNIEFDVFKAIFSVIGASFKP